MNEKIKEISEICSGEETTESRLIALAAWMRENYGSTMIQALRTVLPIQEKIKAKEKKYICLDISEEAGTQLLKEPEEKKTGLYTCGERTGDNFCCCKEISGAGDYPHRI